MKKLLVLAWAAVVGFSAAALTDETVTNDVAIVVGTSMTNDLPAVATDTPPDKPGDGDDPPDGEGGGGTPPDKPSGGGEGGGSDDTVVLTGAWQFDSGTNTLAGSEAGATLSSTNSDENVILAQTNGTLVTVSGYTLDKSGDCTSEDNSNFYAVNAVVAAKSGAMICIDSATLNSNANGANCLFASGDGSTIYAYDCAIASAKDSSRGLDATYEGTVIASKLTIDTSGDHCAALATDRGDGSISVKNALLTTAGQGSPLIYSTGVIEVNGVTGTATGAQIAGIEGLSAIRIRNSDLTGSGEKASEPVANGVIIYQSNSGDYTEGKATFEVADSALASAITNGALFYATHTEADIVVQNTDLAFDTDSNYLLKAAGNDGSNGWGSAGSNGAYVVFAAIDQTLAGDVSVDGISTLRMYLDNSSYTGTFVLDTTYAGSNGVNVCVSSNSQWIVTASCTLQSLTVADGARIVDAGGNVVPIVDASGETLVSGTSDLEIAVTAYSSDEVASPIEISDFEISRSAFEEMYEPSYYFKPHPPENAIVKVKYGDTYLLPDMDHKYWVTEYWTKGVGITVEIIYATETGYFFPDGSSTTNWVLTVTENETDVYPPDGTVAVKAQAKSGSSYYPTLKEAIDAANSRSKITLNDNVTLEETLTVTNSITLDLATNVVTLGSALTNAFHFTANATVSNGTINSTLAANVEEGVLLRFSDCRVTLSDLVVNGSGYESVVAHDSETGSSKKYAMTCDGLVLTGNGCLLSVDCANATLTNDCAFAIDDGLVAFGEHAAAIYCTGNGTVSIFGGTYTASTVLLADDYGVFFKSDDVAIAAPDGYVWENGLLVEESEIDSVTPGVASEPYEDALSATNAAAKINADKANGIVLPTGIEESAVDVYLGKVEAVVTSDNRVVVDLTSAAEAEVQGELDEVITNLTVVASLVSTNASAKVTIATTTPGLYYWIDGGTDVGAVTNAGTSALSTNGGSLELTKPTLDAAEVRAFFRIAAGVSAPVQSNAE